MEISTVKNLESRAEAHILIVPFWKEKDQVQAAIDLQNLETFIQLPLALQDFKAKEGELLLIYVEGQPEKRLALLGLGIKEQITVESLRRAYAVVTKTCHQKKMQELNLALPCIDHLTEDSLLRGIVEGLLLPNYAFNKLKKESLVDAVTSYVKRLNFIGVKDQLSTYLKNLVTICEGVYLARDLTNGNADEVTAAYLARIAHLLAEDHATIQTTVFDKARIEQEKMGLLLAVNRGSTVDPAFIIVEYKGTKKAKEHIVMVGKGITYDTGGLNLKSSGMETMRCDMGGAAVVLAVISVAAKLQLPIHLTAVIPTTDNCISNTSYKPGEVYPSFLGKSVEIGNTDAEGRLVLADALAYANAHLKPTYLIDFATLTGGIEIALGSEATGMMTNSDMLAERFTKAGQETYERVWRLPLFDEYKDHLRSDIADLRNIGTRSASSICAAIFLQYFVGQTPWVHFDIASTAFLTENKRYHPKLATGIGVRLMIEFLQQLNA